MQLKETDIPGLFIVNNPFFEDARGSFVKTFHTEAFITYGIDLTIRETYYSISNKDVVRGMHFQKPPFDHDKLVYACKGQVLDVVLDIRPSSPTFGKYFSIHLKGASDGLFIPKGCAHGFVSLQDDSIMVYNVSTVYNPTADKGILWNSFGFEWPVTDPIMSARDQSFPSFKDHFNL